MTSLQITLISLIPVYALLLFLLLSPLVSYLQRSSYAKACVRTESFIKNCLGLVTYICGNIGAGKTTCGAAISNVLSKVKKEQALSRAAQIREIFSKVDFNKVDAVISLAFQSKLTNTDAILNFLFDNFSDIKGEIENKFYDDGFYPVSYTSLLRDYVDAIIAIDRNRYVYFNRRKFYCWTTDTWAMDYKPSMIDLKDRFLTKDYKIQRYTVIFEDEKVLSGKVSTNFNEVAKEDGGGDTFLRLIRQLGKGTIHYISTAQDFTRVVKQERELATGVLNLTKRTELPVVDLRSVFIDISYDLLTRWQVFLDSFLDRLSVQRYDAYKRKEKLCLEAEVDVPSNIKDGLNKWSSLSSKKGSYLKQIVSNISRIKEKQFADSYINYRGIYYTCADDVGKKKDECAGQVLDVKLTFPIRYAYGSTDTYAFSILNDFVNIASIRSSDFYDPDDHNIPKDDDVSFEQYFLSVLKHRRSSQR